MVVDNVVPTYLVMTVEDQMVSQEGLGINVRICLGFFYANDCMVGAQDSEWIQNALNVLISLFWQYGLVTNIPKYWTMSFQPRALQSGMPEEAVCWRCTVLGEPYCE